MTGRCKNGWVCKYRVEFSNLLQLVTLPASKCGANHISGAQYSRFASRSLAIVSNNPVQWFIYFISLLLLQDAQCESNSAELDLAVILLETVTSQIETASTVKIMTEMNRAGLLLLLLLPPSPTAPSLFLPTNPAMPYHTQPPPPPS